MAISVRPICPSWQLRCGAGQRHPFALTWARPEVEEALTDYCARQKQEVHDATVWSTQHREAEGEARP